MTISINNEKCKNYKDAYEKMTEEFGRKNTEYEKGMQKSIIEQNTYEYLKDHNFLIKIYKLGINNKLSLRKIFNKPHSNEYLKGYRKGISMFKK